MDNQNSHPLPPVIRVFLSSTFADMDKERSYFNEVLVPQLNRICAQRGVSFFSVDLRWGITEDAQVGGQVLPICLSEIDRCRPYFIGILGNRYGSLMEEVPLQITDAIPWLEGKGGCSITELEMLYAVLDHGREDNVPYASFYLRSPRLSQEWYGQGQAEPKLETLKDRIRNDDHVRHATYDSIEEFGEKVMGDILDWCDREFPASDRVQEVRRAWYNGELLRSYVPTAENHAFLDAYIGESQRSLLLYGPGESGKTTLLSAWTPPEGEKLLINCGSDDAFHYWPTVVDAIMRTLGQFAFPPKPLQRAYIRGMLHARAKERNAQLYFTTPQDREAFRVEFRNWVTDLKLPQDLYIVINDLNLLDDEETRMLSWIPAETHGNVHFLCSTNREDMVELADIIGWNCKQMPPFTKEHAAHYLSAYLSIYGKSLSTAQHDALLSSPITALPGYLRTASDFLINYGRFHNLDHLVNAIAALPSKEGLYPYLYDYLTTEAGETVAQLTGYVLGLLTHSPLSLTEGACHSLASRRYPCNALDWSAVRNILEQFRVIKGDYWNITAPALRDTVLSQLTPEENADICETLGDHYTQLLAQAGNEEERQITAYATAILTLYAQAGCCHKLLAALGDLRLLQAVYVLERPALRSACLHLFLAGAPDLEDALFRIFQQVYSQLGREHSLTIAMTDLMVDMEFQTNIPLVQDLMGELGLDGSIRGDDPALSREFRIHMNKLLKLRKEQGVPAFYAALCETLENSQAYNPHELCQILYFKCDCEAKRRMPLEMVQTANQYFATAVKSGVQYEFQTALSSLAQASHLNGNHREAARLQRKLMQLYRARGEFRRYMAICNSLGISLYNMNQCDEAIQQLTRVRDLWMRKGELLEAATVSVNLANTYTHAGQREAAFQLLEQVYAALKNDPAQEARSICASLLGNMGNNAYARKSYTEAEGYLLAAIELSQSLHLESTFLNAASALSSLYQDIGSFMKAFSLNEQIMELYWKRKEYASLMKFFDKARDNLRLCNHNRQAKDFENTWRQRFATVEGGARYFQEHLPISAYDTRELDRLQEALAMARSEGNPLQICHALCALAAERKDNDFAGYWEAMVQAVTILRQQDLTQELEALLLDMLSDSMHHGVPRIPEAPQWLAAQTNMEATGQIIHIWTTLGQYRPKGSLSSQDREELRQLVEHSLDYVDTHATPLFHCWYDMAEVILRHCPAQLTISLVNALSGGQHSLLQDRFEMQYVDKMEENIEELKKDYLSVIATDLLAYYAQALEFLQEFGCRNVATLAGNIAIIHRRRKDQEQTLRYHRLSMDTYRQQNRLYDCLIEQMNLATALKEFQQYHEAIALLREGVKESGEGGILALRAALAGNLAAMLRDFGTAEDHQEIMACFGLEEDFFRSEGLSRDLAISLLNQLFYHHKRNDLASHLPKLQELSKLVRTHSYSEFYQALAYLEHYASQFAQTTKTQESPEDFVQDLLTADDSYRLGRLFQEHGYHCADCFPKKEEEFYAQQLRLAFDPAKDNEVVLIAAFLPHKYAPSASAKLQAYVTWNNESFSFYDMTLAESNFQVQIGTRILAADRQDLKRQLARYLAMWKCDCMNLSLLSLGYDDLDTCRGLKLRVINDSTDN